VGVLSYCQHQQGVARSQRKTSNRKRRHVSVIIGTEELLTNIIFLIDICLFNICFKFNISSNTQHYNNIFINSLGSQNIL
jgi:hypothetical protein